MRSFPVAAPNSTKEDHQAPLLIEALTGPTREEAWTKFIEHWSTLLMKVSRHHAHFDEATNDCFLFLCEKLVENGFGRLKKFDASRGVPFGGWLSVVATHLARDWRRNEFGRRRVPEAVRQLDTFDQAVYHLKFEQRLPVEDCLRALRWQFQPLSRTHVAEALARIHNTLTPAQRWRLAFPARATKQRNVEDPTDDRELHLVSDDPKPEQVADAENRSADLETALMQLTPEQRLLIELRFGKQLSLADVARIAGYANLHLARRRIESALVELRRLMRG